MAMQTSANSRYLFLMRHAKAANASAYDDDHARPLTEIGLDAARRIGQHWQAIWPLPEWVWCSDAMRTKQTFLELQKGLGAELPVQFDNALYMASTGDMLAMLQRTPAAIERVLMVAHNPGTHHLAHTLASDASLDVHDALNHKYPTGTLSVFRVPNEMAWGDLAPASLTLEALVMPKKI